MSVIPDDDIPKHTNPARKEGFPLKSYSFDKGAGGEKARGNRISAEGETTRKEVCARVRSEYPIIRMMCAKGPSCV